MRRDVPLASIVGTTVPLLCCAVAALTSSYAATNFFFLLGAAAQLANVVVFVAGLTRPISLSLSLREVRRASLLSIVVGSAGLLGHLFFALLKWSGGEPGWATGIAALGLVLLPLVPASCCIYSPVDEYLKEKPDVAGMSWTHCQSLTMELRSAEGLQEDAQILRERLSIAAGEHYGFSRAALLPTLEKISFDPGAFALDAYTLVFPSQINQKAWSIRGLKGKNVYGLDEKLVTLTREGVKDVDREEREKVDAFMRGLAASGTTSPPSDLRYLYLFCLLQPISRLKGGRFSVDMVKNCPDCPDVKIWMRGCRCGTEDASK